MTTKPCIQCGIVCEILPVQLGDSFTLTYLRVCGGECMFLVAYDYLYEIGYHKDFRNKLYEQQNEEDKNLRDEFIHITTEQFLEDFKKNLQENPKLLSMPTPNCIHEMFSATPQIPIASSGSMRFTRASKEKRLQWAKEHVERVKEKLEEAMKDMEKIENE